MLLISVICSPLGLWLPLSGRASASWKRSRKMLEIEALRASALTGGWSGNNSHFEVSAGYTCAKLTFHQGAFAVRSHALGWSEPRNLVIPNRWYWRTVLCWTFCKRRDYCVYSGTGILEGPIHLITKSQAFQWRWCPEKSSYWTILSRLHCDWNGAAGNWRSVSPTSSPGLFKHSLGEWFSSGETDQKPHDLRCVHL